ncbi:beta-N-acetylhexosaminidase [Tieghemostelium lacteum]|uniref:Beta-hexosaminidase n=1 Tax=Tieghemostelium lacteum TaxID=361077 RepID=A0A151Z3U8_TIELA|nr:beta-N-acetylhexosaminidase [Tieghemostelium lacteum]|eukprot:KYQ88618.1 beta-N-acetylhexosaminidase [Tieghemostelium lacteum]
MKLLLICIIISLSILFSNGQDQSLNLVPYPQSVTNYWTTVSIQPSGFSIQSNSASLTLAVAIKRYSALMFPFGEGNGTSGSTTLQITVSSSNEDLFLGVDESYQLSTSSSSSFSIQSNTIYGAMRGLETFKQLMVYDLSNNEYFLSQCSISDYPRFPWRGFMIDTARHYYPVDAILHMIDSLGYNKFNVLHWHIVDAVAWPVVSSTYPQLTDAAYAPSAVYSHSEIQQVVAYAKTYGIRVVPEFDIPGHAASWGVGYPDVVATCPAYAGNVNNIPLDISNPATYTFIENLFTEIVPLFPDQYFHTGGDEVVLQCWSDDPAIQSWMTKNGYNTVTAEQYFESQLDTILQKLNRTKLIWNDPIDNGCDIIKSAIVQVWNSDTDSQTILDDGYKILVSFDWYLDKQDPTGDIHYEWQDTWQDFYNADPYNNISSHTQNILGGEATMWSEQVSHVNWDVRVWPRTIGIGERLWSDQSINSVDDALPRIELYSCDLSRRGIASGPLTPGDYCPLPTDLAYTLKPVMHIDSKTLLEIYNSF